MSDHFPRRKTSPWKNLPTFSISQAAAAHMTRLSRNDVLPKIAKNKFVICQGTGTKRHSDEMWSLATFLTSST